MDESVRMFTRDILVPQLEKALEGFPEDSFPPKLLEEIAGCAGYNKNADGLIRKLCFLYHHLTIGLPEAKRRLPLELALALLPAMAPAGPVVDEALRLARRRG